MDPDPLNAGSLRENGDAQEEDPSTLAPIPGVPSFLWGDASLRWENMDLGRLSLLLKDLKIEFGIHPDDVLAMLTAGLSHCMGKASCLLLPQGMITPGFSVMVVTDEPEPAWTRQPMRMLQEGMSREFLAELEMELLAPQIPIIEKLMPRGAMGSFPPGLEPPGSPPKPGGAGAAARGPEQAGAPGETERRRRVIRFLGTVHRDSVAAPFRRSEIDERVSLGTPRRGLPRALDELDEAGRRELEESLAGGREAVFRPDAAPVAQANFFWQVTTREARLLFRKHAWLARLPFFLHYCPARERPCLDPGAPGVKQLRELGEQMLLNRISRSRWREPRIFKLSELSAKEVSRFLLLAAKCKEEEEEEAGWPITPWRVAEMGLRIAMVLSEANSILLGDEESELMPMVTGAGLAAAKRYARLHCQNLAALAGPAGKGPAESADLAGLSRRESQVYLKILERSKLTRPALRKLFHRMSAAERDEIVAKLAARNLIRCEGGALTRNDAAAAK